MTPFIATDKRIKYIFSSPGNRRGKKKSAGLIGDCFTLGVLEKVWMIETKEKHKQNNRKKKNVRETVAFCCFYCRGRLSGREGSLRTTLL